MMLEEAAFYPGAPVPRRNEDNLMRQGLLVASVGIEMAAAVGIGYLIGSKLDEHFGTQPYLTWFFLGCGIAAAFLGLWRSAKRYWPRDASGE